MDIDPTPADAGPPETHETREQHAPADSPFDMAPGVVIGPVPRMDACISGTDGEMSDDQLVELLAATSNVAIVGMSPRESRTSYQVAATLHEHSHFSLFFVNPTAVDQEALGKPFYSSLAALPVTPDMVDVFRRSEDVPPVMADAFDAGAASVWLQLGIVNDEAQADAATAGIPFVQNRCLKVEYLRLKERILERRAALGLPTTTSL